MPKSVPVFFLIITVVILIFVGQKLIPSKFFNTPSSTLTPTPYSSGYATVTPTPYSGPRPDTIITSGPASGEVISGEAVAVFHYIAVWSGDMKDISFETKVGGIDNDWQGSSNTYRVFNLLSGDHAYTFQVRAKTNSGIYDLTPAERTFRAVVSTSMGKVKITSVSPGYFPSQIMEITLRNDGDPIKISGWSLNSTTNKFVIPKGVGFYDSSVLVQPSDIILKTGDYLHVFGATSPMDMNFRLNKCFGYLNALYNFVPSLSNQCPYPDRTDLLNTSLACQNYILGLSSCQIPDAGQLNNIGDSACRSFSDGNLNYSGCFRGYHFDPDFLKNEWYVYSGSNFVKDKDESVELKDADGLLVDHYEY